MLDILVILASCSAANQTIIFAAPQASNDGDGSQARPFTLQAAIAAMSGRGPGSTLLLRGGDYPLLGYTLALNATHSGAPNNPVTYASYPGEQARLIGGVEIPASAFTAPPAGSRAPPGVLAAMLGPLGITNASMLGGEADIMGLKSEFFVDDGSGVVVPAQFAQDPNPNPAGEHRNSSWVWAGYDDIVDCGDTWFVFNNTRRVEQGNWVNATGSVRGLYLLGHWGNPQAFDAIKIVSIVPVRAADSAITIEAYNISLNVGSRGLSQRGFQLQRGERFVAVDALALLDRPSEYWIDRERQILYYFPPHDFNISSNSTMRFYLSVGPSLLSPKASIKYPQALVELQAASWIRWVNISVAASTQSLFSASGVSGLLLDSCQFYGAGATCLSIDGSNSIVRGSEIAHCGGKGAVLRGGNWQTYDADNLFKSANMSFVANEFYDWARWQRVAASPGISWSGVGHVLSGNTLRDAPTPAVTGDGNVDCVFEENNITLVNYEQSDMGAYYHGSSSGGYQFGWTQPGNVIRRNKFSHIKFLGAQLTDGEKFTTQSVYMDDELSGYTIENNSFSDVDVGVLIGGGREHRVLNNSFKDCGTACIHLDNRGMNWAHELCGCYCAFDSCVQGCSYGAAVGPGLDSNFSADAGTFRFEQGMALLRCVGPNAAPPCTKKAGLEWLATVLDDKAGGGPCAPARNLFRGNSFHTQKPPWQICGDINNASKFHHSCSTRGEPNPADVQAWGSVTLANTLE